LFVVVLYTFRYQPKPHVYYEIARVLRTQHLRNGLPQTSVSEEQSTHDNVSTIVSTSSTKSGSTRNNITMTL
jgi:hypothetical protein